MTKLSTDCADQSQATTRYLEKKDARPAHLNLMPGLFCGLRPHAVLKFEVAVLRHRLGVPAHGLGEDVGNVVTLKLFVNLVLVRVL